MGTSLEHQMGHFEVVLHNNHFLRVSHGDNPFYGHTDMIVSYIYIYLNMYIDNIGYIYIYTYVHYGCINGIIQLQS